MSNKYTNIKDVPTNVIADRLDELSDAVTKGKAGIEREFTMRIPAELDRDADIILAEAAKRIRQLIAYQPVEPYQEQKPEQQKRDRQQQTGAV